MTLAVYIGVGLLLAWALIRRPQMIVIVLAVAFGLAVWVADFAHGGGLRSILMGIDGLVVIAMWLLWVRFDSERAVMVASIGLLKIWFGIAAALLDLSSLVWASGNNALFVIQVLIAGGFADGIVAWLGRCHHRLHSGDGGLLGHLEKMR